MLKEVLNKHRLRIIFALTLSFQITSCDCWTFGDGVVVDSITNLPLDSVSAKSFIEYVNDQPPVMEFITDSTGVFEGTTGNTGKCRDLIIELSRKGYTTKIVVNPNYDTIRMTKE